MLAWLTVSITLWLWASCLVGLITKLFKWLKPCIEFNYQLMIWIIMWEWRVDWYYSAEAHHGGLAGRPGTNKYSDTCRTAMTAAVGFDQLSILYRRWVTCWLPVILDVSRGSLASQLIICSGRAVITGKPQRSYTTLTWQDCLPTQLQ